MFLLCISAPNWYTIVMFRSHAVHVKHAHERKHINLKHRMWGPWWSKCTDLFVDHIYYWQIKEYMLLSCSILVYIVCVCGTCNVWVWPCCSHWWCSYLEAHALYLLQNSPKMLLKWKSYHTWWNVIGWNTKTVLSPWYRRFSRFALNKYATLPMDVSEFKGMQSWWVTLPMSWTP